MSFSEAKSCWTFSTMLVFLMVFGWHSSCHQKCPPYKTWQLFKNISTGHGFINVENFNIWSVSVVVYPSLKQNLTLTLCSMSSYYDTWHLHGLIHFHICAHKHMQTGCIKGYPTFCIYTNTWSFFHSIFSGSSPISISKLVNVHWMVLSLRSTDCVYSVIVIYLRLEDLN